MTAHQKSLAGLIVFICGCVLCGATVARGQGACCLVDGCMPVEDGPACSALGGFYLDGGDCAADACGIGACCADPSCVMIDAFSCLSGARDFQGAGTQCADDPCAIGAGACCTDGTCTVVPEQDCTAGGGAWLGFGTICAAEPCTLGACCVPGGCMDTARYECDDPDNTFFAGLECESGACEVPDDCPADSLFSQQRDTPDFFTGYTSEADPRLVRYDDFHGVPGPITALRWWGFDLDAVGTSFIECVESDVTVNVTFHTDAGGVPGPSVCSYTLTASRRSLGISYLGADLNEYEVTLPEPCVLVHGWVSIVGLGDPECWFLWLSAGAGESYCEGCLSKFETDDLSFCLIGTAGGVTGACCDEPTGQCTDGADIADCVETSQVFAPGATCADFDPPCGILTGACCFDDATCSILQEEDCATQGGNWLGAHTLCSYCPCSVPCPEGGMLEGEPECHDGYVDEYNGGCDAATQVFQPIEFCEPVCGKAGIFLEGLEITADFDWYEIQVETATTLTWHVEAEFPVGAWIVDGRGGCAEAFVITSLGAFECSPIAISAVVEPGTYWLVVAPAAATDLATCDARYTARATSSTACLVEYDTFGPCVTGPGMGLSPGCELSDLDGDHDVDLRDFALYQDMAIE